MRILHSLGLFRVLNFRIVVHGGAGFWGKDVGAARIGVREAATVGMDILAAGGSALDGAERAVMVMEDNPIFNAGVGSALTCAGTVEMDAAVMDGRDLSAGAVALVRRVKNPVHLARMVMERTDHVLIAGDAAERLAKSFRLETTNPITARRQRALAKLRVDARKGRLPWLRKNQRLLQQHSEIGHYDTVGAVALDKYGNYAAAASTGGMGMKLPGRIGDTPLIGSGLYCDNAAGAATATGWGEVAVKLGLSRAVCMMMGDDSSASKAVATCVQMATRRLHGQAGMIAIDSKGKIAAAQNTAYMPWAYGTQSMKKPRVYPKGREIAPLR